MGVVCYQRRSGNPGQRPGPLRHREPDHRPRRRQAFRPEQIHGTQGPVGASAAVRPGALPPGKGHPGREQVPAPYPGRPGHPPQVQGRIKSRHPAGKKSPHRHCETSAHTGRGNPSPLPGNTDSHASDPCHWLGMTVRKHKKAGIPLRDACFFLSLSCRCGDATPAPAPARTSASCSPPPACRSGCPGRSTSRRRRWPR